MAYMTFKGPIEKGLCVMHKCDNPPYINPAHLKLGTRFENMRDSLNKGRMRNRYGKLRFGGGARKRGCPVKSRMLIGLQLGPTPRP